MARLLALLSRRVACRCRGPAAFAHEVRPAYLEITERADGTADILWKQPSQGLLLVALEPRITGGLTDRKPDTVSAATNFEIRGWRAVDLKGRGLDGREVKVEGLDRTITDVLLLVTLRNGDRISQVLTPAAPSFVIDARAGAAVPAYLLLGVEHILTGIDHLLFVFGLLLLSTGWRQLWKTITAFTIAHSITLALTALKLININPQLIEAMVAYSIVFLAVELMRKQRGKTGLTPAPAMAGRVRLRPAPRRGLRRRAEGDRPARGQHPGLAVPVQRRRGAWPAAVRRRHGGRAATAEPAPLAGGGAASRLDRRELCHRVLRHILVPRTHAHRARGHLTSRGDNHMTKSQKRWILAGTAGAALSYHVVIGFGTGPAEAAQAASPAQPDAASVVPNGDRNAYFGDLHLHTTNSFDAYMLMGTKTTPDEAYRFARGDTITYLGQPVRRSEPLDFLAVTDHSENIGVFNQLDDPNSEFSLSDIGKLARARRHRQLPQDRRPAPERHPASGERQGGGGIGLGAQQRVGQRALPAGPVHDLHRL